MRDSAVSRPSMAERAQLIQTLDIRVVQHLQNVFKGEKTFRGARPVMASQCSSTRSHAKSQAAISFIERENAWWLAQRRGCQTAARPAFPGRSLSGEAGVNGDNFLKQVTIKCPPRR